MLLADKIESSLKRFSLSLENNLIKDIDTTRAVFIAPYYIEDEEKLKRVKAKYYLSI